MARGGTRTPKNPAPVSGPGALSQRTDGGAGQPIRVAGGQPYGQRQQLEQTQAAAPMAAGQPPPSPAGNRPSLSRAPGPPDGGGIFGPTQRPQEAPNTGLTAQPGMLADDPDGLIRYLYSIHPHPDLLRLLDPARTP